MKPFNAAMGALSVCAAAHKLAWRTTVHASVYHNGQQVVFAMASVGACRAASRDDLEPGEAFDPCIWIGDMAINLPESELAGFEDWLATCAGTAAEAESQP